MSALTHITDYLDRCAQRYPDKQAFVCADRMLTWRELQQYVEQLSMYVAGRIPADQGQQVVGILLPNSWQFVVVYLGVLRAGHIVLPLDPSFKKLENQSIAEQVKPVLTFTNGDFVGELPDEFEVVLFEGQLPIHRDAGSARPLRLPAAEQIATLLFTSGTTGKPKVTAYSHANHMWNISAVSDLWEWTVDDTILLSLPLSHWHGLVMGIVGALYHGNTVYLHERFDAAATVTALQSGNVSLYMHVPIAYYKLVEYAGGRTFDMPNVRLCISGSSYLPPAIWKAFQKAYGQDILERYGSSETGLIASNTLDSRMPGRVGHVLSGVTVRVEASGELAMDSPGRFLGYFRNPEATAKNITSDGLWLTGDIGEFDDANSLRLKGRIQEKIKKLGYTVFPRDVEWALLKNPDIRDAVVVGIQVPESLSDTMVYFLVTTLSVAQVQAFSKVNLPSAWRADRIIVLPEIPKTRSGKPKLAQLRATLEKE